MRKITARYIAWLLAILLCFNNFYMVNASGVGEVDTVSGGDVTVSGDTVSCSDVIVSENVPADIHEEDTVSVSAGNVTIDEMPAEDVTGNDNEFEENLKTDLVLSRELYAAKQDLSVIAEEIQTLKAGKDYVEHEVVASVADMAEAMEIAGCYEAEVIECWEGIAVFSVEPEVESVMAVAASFDNDYPPVYPNYIYNIESDSGVSAVSDDPFIGNQWHHQNIATEKAWDITKGAGVVVAIVDTGIDTDHPDLVNNIKGMGNSIDGTGTVEDGNGHGTHVAGIVAAGMNNGIGGVGVAPESSILAIKAIDDNGTGTTASVVRGIYLALARDAKIINLSVSSYVYDELNKLAVETAVNAGCIVVAAAGNASTEQKVYPAAYEEVIAVGATDRNDDMSYFSNYGDWVEIAAPGSSIYSTIPDGKYGYKSGTSMSAPMVSGTIALILASRQELLETSNSTCLSKVREILQNTRREKSYTYGLRSLYGGVYAFGAVAGNEEMLVAELPQVIPSAYVPGKSNYIYSGKDNWVELVSSQKNAEIYYTLDGKTPTKKTGILYTGPIVFEKKGNVTIKAIAVVGEHTSKVVTKKYKMVALTETVTPLYGEEQIILKGKSMKLQLQTTPSYVSNKSVTWQLVERTSSVLSFDKKTGTIKCSSKAQGGESAVVKATAKDGSGASTLIRVSVSADAAKPVLDTESLVLTSIEDDTNELLKDMTKTYQLKVTADTRQNQYTFSSSNKKVATVDEKGLITAVGKGTAKIKVVLRDGSNKYAVCTVKVITPVTTINTLKTSTGYYTGDGNWDIFYGTGYVGDEAIPIGKGSKITLKTYLNRDYTWRNKTLKDTNKPSDSKIIWTSDDVGIIKVKNGVVSCTSTAVPGQTVTITATAADGYGASVSITFKVCDKISKIYAFDEGKKRSSGYTKTMEVGDYIEDYTQLLYMVSNGRPTTEFDVIISNKDIATVFRCEQTVSNGKVINKLVYDQKGKAIRALKKGAGKITFKAKDGSNKKIVIKLKVK